MPILMEVFVDDKKVLEVIQNVDGKIRFWELIFPGKWRTLGTIFPEKKEISEENNLEIPEMASEIFETPVLVTEMTKEYIENNYIS